MQNIETQTENLVIKNIEDYPTPYKILNNKNEIKIKTRPVTGLFGEPAQLKSVQHEGWPKPKPIELLEISATVTEKSGW